MSTQRHHPLLAAHSTSQREMNRLHKKCFILSAGFHLLLALILVVGPGFFVSKKTMEDLPTLNIIPDTVIDGALRQGGPNAKATPAPPPPPLPPASPPKQSVEKQRDPEPPKVKDTKQEDSLELANQNKKKKIDVSIKI